MCEYAEVFVNKNRKARKQHKCCECGRPINSGTDYRYSSGIFDGDPFDRKTCLKCAELIDFVWSLPETECIDSSLYDHLNDCEYIDNYPNDEEFERGGYCTLTANVPWLKRVGEYWELVVEKGLEARSL